jgi:hypothetical protein
MKRHEFEQRFEEGGINTAMLLKRKGQRIDPIPAMAILYKECDIDQIHRQFGFNGFTYFCQEKPRVFYVGVLLAIDYLRYAT